MLPGLDVKFLRLRTETLAECQSAIDVFGSFTLQLSKHFLRLRHEPVAIVAVFNDTFVVDQKVYVFFFWTHEKRL